MDELGISGPFELLSRLEQQIRQRAAPLPEGKMGPGEWKGIAFYLKEWPLVARQGIVSEVLIPPRITRVPGTHPWVLGIANVHGTPLPVVDLVDFFWGERLPSRPTNRVLLISRDDLQCGALVSEVAGIRHFSPQDECAEPRPFPPELADYLVGYRRHDGVAWGEFSMQALLESPGIIDLSIG